tara:strand:+ start:27671 stop:27997 length:327 start_codon:yes stop_codon:yes gene_type:complete
MKSFKLNADSKRLLQNIKKSFLKETFKEEEKRGGMWFEILEYGNCDVRLTYFFKECQDCHEAFNKDARHNSATKISMGCIRLNYNDSYTIQMSQQVIKNDLNMAAIEV